MTRFGIIAALVVLTVAGPADAQYVYRWFSDRIVRNEVDGSNFEVILTHQDLIDQGFSEDVQPPTSFHGTIDIDSVDGKLYFRKTLPSQILRCNMDGTNIELVTDANMGNGLTVYHPPDVPAPTASEWGLVVMVLLILTAATAIFARRRVVAT